MTPLNYYKISVEASEDDIGTLISAILTALPHLHISVQTALKGETTADILKKLSRRPDTDGLEVPVHKRTKRSNPKHSDTQISAPPSPRSRSWQTGMEFLNALKKGQRFDISEIKAYFKEAGFQPQTGSPMATHLRRAGLLRCVSPGTYEKL